MKYLAVAAGALAMCAIAPAVTHAAVTAAVTGDDGNPAALTPNVPLGIRNVDVKAFVHVDAADATSWQWVVTDAAGTGATTVSPCWISRFSSGTDDSRYVTYRGNQAYTLTLRLHNGDDCAALKSTVSYGWNVAGSVSLGQPAGALLTRQPNSFSTITQQLDFAGTPGAISYEIKYAKDATVAADGSLAAAVMGDAFLDRATGKVQVFERAPGEYKVVARAKSGDYYTPWSAPVTMKLLAPFDLSSRTFPDQRGPRYQVRGVLGETSARGKVTVAIASGSKGKHFRTLGKAKLSSKGVFKLRFTVRKYGKYRLRYSYSGSSAVARGTVYDPVRIKRVLG